MKYKLTLKNGDIRIVPEKVGLALLKGAPKVAYDNGQRMVDLNMIAFIDPETESYHEDKKSLEAPKEAPKVYSRERYLKALKSMIEGCRKVKGPKAEKLVERMQAKYEKVVKGTEENHKSPIQEFFEGL